MKPLLPLLAAVVALAGCGRTAPALPNPGPVEASQPAPADVEPTRVVPVTNAAELRRAIAEAMPGTDIVMADGEWRDLEIRFVGTGTAERPITLRAETPGGVRVTGASNLRLAGEHLVVDGLHFRDGASPSSAVIRFSVSDDSLANHSRVTNCVIDGFNKPQRNMTDLWVQFHGRRNALDHCYLAGKSNRGPTVRVDLDGNPSIYNHHRITNNHFGPRPPKGGPSAETIQIGDSRTSMTPSYTLVADNLFDRCDGEVEVISSKANFNSFRGNVFYRSEGSLVTRHGNYATVDANVFIGDGASTAYGGVRLIGTGHWVTNNLFYGLRGQEFRAPIAMMNGIPKSSINRYFQVTDVVVAHNTWIDTASPWQIGVGANTDQAEVLPASEIRSEPPVRTLFANNVIVSPAGGTEPIVRYDSVDGIDFRSNVIDNHGVPFDGVAGLEPADFSASDAIVGFFPAVADLNAFDVHQGFEFDRIDRDLLGRSRAEHNAIGATNGTLPDGSTDLLDRSRFGPSWFDPAGGDAEPQTIAVRDAGGLILAIDAAADGDVIEIAPGRYQIAEPLAIDKALTVRATPGARPTIRYTGAAGSPLFEMNPRGNLRLSGVALEGTGANQAFATLATGMSSLYTLTVEDAEISDFASVLYAHKYSFADRIHIEGTTIRDCANGLELSSEDDDKGDYNAEFVTVLDSRFERVAQNAVDYYRGGYDESTVGGTLTVRGSTFTGSGADERGVLINTYGIINVELSGNTFRDNSVELVARLWGAKNNAASGNVIEDSGEIVTEQNLPLKLVY